MRKPNPCPGGIDRTGLSPTPPMTTDQSIQWAGKRGGCRL